MAKHKKEKTVKLDPFSEEVVRKKRVLPVPRMVGLVLLLILQIIAIAFAVLYTPTPQDRIDRYELTVEPQADGTLDMTYRFVWTPLDEDEYLTWVEIGMPNPNFDFYTDSFSSTIASAEKYVDGDFVSARLDLDRPYKAGETLTFSFRIRQRAMLCKMPEGYFYELIPGWFNATPVESYSFVWTGSPAPTSANASTERDGLLTWEGSMPSGTYVPMKVNYAEGAFTGASTVRYRAFEPDGVWDELQGDKTAMVFVMIILCVVILITQIYMIDCVVSYHRGRGFMTGYGHHVHIYGRTNLKYKKEKEKHSSRGGHSGGGCACACACACAGGGRAGCSQKDTHAYPLRQRDDEQGLK